MLRAVLSLVITGAAVYSLLLLVLFLAQSRLLYFPAVGGRVPVQSPAVLDLAWEDVTLRAADGIRLHGWFVPGPAGSRTVLFCHGNAGNISHRLDWLRIFNSLGLGVLIFDYRGYGHSEGRPGEEGTYQDAAAAWDYLVRERRIAPEDIIVFGESLGAAVAAALAAGLAGTAPPGGLILHSSFISVPELAADLYPWLPARRLSRYWYGTADYVARSEAPLLVVHSPDDEIVPFRHGQEVFQQGREPKTFLEIFGDHNAGFLLSEPVLRRGLQAFLESLPAGREP